MAERLLSIGGLGLRLSGGDTLRRAMCIAGMETFAVATADVAFEVLLDSELRLPSCRLLHEFDIVDGQMRCRFGVDAEGVYYYAFGRMGLLRYDERIPNKVFISTVHDPSVLRFALWTAYAMAGVRLGAVPVHSSVVVCDGRAVMCLGESGTGKSTHTRLWINNIPDTHLLNDDSPILSVAPTPYPLPAGRGGKDTPAPAEGEWKEVTPLAGKGREEVRVYGSPWGGKTDCFLAERHPVAGLLRLEQRPENSIRRLGVVEAFAALQPSCPPAMAHEERCLDLLVKFISNVIERVPIYRMGCLPDAAAAQMSHDTILGQ